MTEKILEMLTIRDDEYIAAIIDEFALASNISLTRDHLVEMLELIERGSALELVAFLMGVGKADVESMLLELAVGSDFQVPTKWTSYSMDNFDLTELNPIEFEEV